MGLRFRRSIKIAPGVKVNLTKTGWGMTVGPRGNHYSVHSSGRRTRTVGLPGTGMYYQSIAGGGRGGSSRPRGGTTPLPAARPIDVAGVIPRPGIFASGAEKAYHAGLVAYLHVDNAASLAAFEQALGADPSLASAHLLAGVAANSLADAARATAHLEAVVTGPHAMPDRWQLRYLGDPRLSLSLQVKITNSVTAHPAFSPLGAALSLAELYQDVGRLSEAIGLVQQIHQALPDPVVRLSLADLLFAEGDFDGVIDLTTGVANDSDIDAEALHLRGAAMTSLGHHVAAIEVFGLALAKRAGREPALLNAIRYDRGLAYEQSGQRARAQADLERVYAADPTFEDVKDRLLGLGAATSPALGSSPG